MRTPLADYRVFWREFRHTFHSTGAVLPSGRRLARALASRIAAMDPPQKILEVGPGTGAVTRQIISRMGPNDQLDLVELNPRFAEVLRNHLDTEPSWKPVAGRVRVWEMPVEQIDASEKYDVIVSGLPLNNFAVAMVQEILSQFHSLAAVDASLSFFEYIAVRKAKSLLCRRSERRRLSGIERLLFREFQQWEMSRQCIVSNVPPAWVHHLQLPGKSRVESPEPRARSTASSHFSGSRPSTLDSKKT